MKANNKHYENCECDYCISKKVIDLVEILRNKKNEEMGIVKVNV
jgi:hypothetical protein